jgi:hypothetical protein
MTRTWRVKYGYGVLVLVLPLVLVTWFFGGLTPLNTHQLPYFYSVSSDQAQQVWFLSWPAHAIAHGLNPFVSGSLNAPHGVNLMSNTAMVLLGILMAPVTWVLGPLSAFVAVCEGGIVLTTWSLTWVMRRVGVGRAGSLVAGLLFGFNPLAVAAVTVHPYLAFKPFMPLVAYWLYRILASSTSRWHDGVWLGMCVAGMFLVMQEAAGASLYLGSIVLFVAAIIWRSQLTIDDVRERLRPLAVGVVTALALLAYPLWIMFAGPWHVVGEPHEFLGDFHADALAFVVAPGTFNGSLLGMSDVVNSLRITPWENGVYIGPLILVLVAGWWWRRRSRVAWWLGISGLAIASLVLGAHLSVAGHQTSLPLPMAFLQHLPLGSSVIPARFMSFLWLLVAVAIGLMVNELLVTHQGRVAMSSRRTVVAWGAIALGLFFVAPSAMNSRWTPPHQAALTSPRFAALVPSGSVVLTYPYASAINSEAMTDLALAANRYRLIGGRAMVPSPGTGMSQGIEPLAPVGIFNTFLHAQFSDAELAFVRLALNHPVGTSDSDIQFHADLADFIVRHHVNAVVATMTGPGASHIRVLLTSTLGAPQRVGRVWVWVVRPSSIH